MHGTRATTGTAGRTPPRSGRCGGAKVTVREAVDAALKARPGTVVAAELDADDGARALRDVDVLGSDGNWYELTLDGATGKVTHQERDGSDESNDRDGPDGSDGSEGPDGSDD